MKHVKLVLLLACIGQLLGCQEEEHKNLQPVAVQFTFSTVSNNETGGRQAAADFPEGSFLRISILQADGIQVHTLKAIGLVKIGNAYISEPLLLEEGSYSITDYIVVSPGDQALYVAPKAGAPLAAQVNRPLPFSFQVNSNSLSQVSVEVIDASLASPEAFGYVSFSIDVVPVKGFGLSVFHPDDQQSSLSYSQGRAYVLHGKDTVFKQNTLSKINSIIWNANDTATYTLTVIQHGYDRYEKKFKLSELLQELGNKPLTVVLKPAFTLSLIPILDHDVDFSMVSTPGSNLRIDWGDGSVQHYTVDEEWFPLTHRYTKNDKAYFVTMTEDIADIKSFEMFYGPAIVDTVSIVYLPALEEFGLGLMEYTATGVDFSRNSKIQTIRFPLAGENLRMLDISNNPLLTNLDLSEAQLPTAAVDKIVNDLYASVLKNNRKGFANFWSPNSYLIGPPSPGSFDKLHKLINDHGWIIHPINM